MELEIERVGRRTFNVQGAIEIRVTGHEMASEVMEVLRKELADQKIWMEKNLGKTQQTEPSKISKRLLSVNETAQFLGISPRTIYNAISRGSAKPFPVKPKRPGRRVRFDIQELNKYIDSL